MTFDIVRSLCILWIVGVWHLKDYLPFDGITDETMRLGELVTTSVLGAFTFISGFFLKKYKMRSVSDVGHFYKKRLLRFGIPYLIAAASIYVASMIGGDPWFRNPLNFILSMVGLSIFYPPLPPTYWYITMLVLFYILTPLMLVPRRQSVRVALYLVMEILFILLWQWGVTEDQCMVYFSTYALGLLVGNKHVALLKGWPTRLGVIVCMPLLLGLSLMCKSHLHFLLICWELLGLPLLIVMADLLSKSQWVSAAGRKVSYASMNMYLFHRHIYLFCVIALNIRSMHNIHDAVMPLWFGWLVALPVIIVFSYFFQKGYEKYVIGHTMING